MHYEIEQAGAGRSTARTSAPTPSPSAGTWSAVIDADAVPMPLRFDTLDQALAYVARTPGTLRVVEVNDEGERVPVDRRRPVRHVAQAPSHYEVELRQPTAERADRHGVAGGQARRAGREHGAADVRQPGGGASLRQAHETRRRRGSWRWSTTAGAGRWTPERREEPSPGAGRARPGLYQRGEARVAEDEDRSAAAGREAAGLDPPRSNGFIPFWHALERVMKHHRGMVETVATGRLIDACRRGPDVVRVVPSEELSNRWRDRPPPQAECRSSAIPATTLTRSEPPGGTKATSNASA